MTQDRAELGNFLRSRRDRLTPAQAGITAFPGPRRVPGLRREELAVLAGLSPDYYSRLEQGRQTNVSNAVLDALGRALRLDETEMAHLRDLAAPADGPSPRLTSNPPAQRPDPGLLRVMAALDHLPVVLIGQRAEVLATNELATAVVGHLPLGRSLARFLFFDPVPRSRIINWPTFAASAIAALRREAGRRPYDTALHSLVDDLCSNDPDAARWWGDHTVRDYSSATKQIRHPVGGDLSFDIEIVAGPHDPDQRLVVYTTEVDSPTARVLPLLASWKSASTETVAAPEPTPGHMDGA